MKSLFTIFLTLAFISAKTQDIKINFGSVECNRSGTKIIFSAIKVKSDWSDYKNENWMIFEYNLADKSMTEIAKASTYPSYSPDGNKIAYGKLGSNSNLFIYDVNSKKKVQITNDTVREFAPTWSRDGGKIIYNSNKTGTIEIFSANADGTDPVQLTHSGEFKCYNPVCSPFSDEIVYYLEKGDHKDQIYVMNIDGTKARNLTSDDNHNYFPGWIDEQTVSFTFNPNEVHSIKTDGTGKNKIAEIKSFYARFSYDGKYMFFINTENPKQANISKLDIATKQITPLVNREDLDSYFNY